MARASSPPAGESTSSPAPGTGGTLTSYPPAIAPARRLLVGASLVMARFTYIFLRATVDGMERRHRRAVHDAATAGYLTGQAVAAAQTAAAELGLERVDDPGPRPGYFCAGTGSPVCRRALDPSVPSSLVDCRDGCALAPESPLEDTHRFTD